MNLQQKHFNIDSPVRFYGQEKNKNREKQKWNK